MIRRPLRTFITATAVGGTLLAFTGCHGQAVQRNFSPLIGSWAIQGDVPEPGPDLPRFTHLTFRRDGSLQATYVKASGALAGVLKPAPKIATESDSYTLLEHHHLRIVEGSRSLEYTYGVHDGKLFLRSADAQSTESTVFVKQAADNGDAAGAAGGDAGDNGPAGNDNGSNQ